MNHYVVRRDLFLKNAQIIPKFWKTRTLVTRIHIFCNFHLGFDWEGLFDILRKSGNSLAHFWCFFSSFIPTPCMATLSTPFTLFSFRFNLFFVSFCLQYDWLIWYDECIHLTWYCICALARSIYCIIAVSLCRLKILPNSSEFCLCVWHCVAHSTSFLVPV